MKLANEEEWKHKIIDAPQFESVKNFSKSAIDLSIVGKVQPSDQWRVTAPLSATPVPVQLRCAVNRRQSQSDSPPITKGLVVPMRMISHHLGKNNLLTKALSGNCSITCQDKQGKAAKRDSKPTRAPNSASDPSNTNHPERCQQSGPGLEAPALVMSTLLQHMMANNAL